MIRPPALGPHARHRSLGTPGPTGYNDHGDPSHRRRHGATPGPLGHNDHGMPLPSQPRHSVVNDDEVAMMINGIIDQANRVMASAPLERRLQFCTDLAKKNRRQSTGEEDQRYRDVECYFAARTEAIDGKANISRHLTDQSINWANGSFDQSWAGPGEMPFEFRYPSRNRLGRWSRQDEDQPVPRPYRNSSRWAASGATDGLRDRSLREGELQRHKRPPTNERANSAFPRSFTD
jgi:hypothetical protein